MSDLQPFQQYIRLMVEYVWIMIVIKYSRGYRKVIYLCWTKPVSYGKQVLVPIARNWRRQLTKWDHFLWSFSTAKRFFLQYTWVYIITRLTQSLTSNYALNNWATSVNSSENTSRLGYMTDKANHKTYTKVHE